MNQQVFVLAMLIARVPVALADAPAAPKQTCGEKPVFSPLYKQQ